MPRRLTVISWSPPTKMEHPTTMGHLRTVTEPIQAWGNLQNSIGGSQKSPLSHHKAWKDLHNLIGGPQEISMEAPQILGRSPQLNWRSPSNPLSRLGFQEPKSKKLNELFTTESPRRTQTDATDAMARIHKVLKSFSLKSYQSNECYGEI
jgi:hypothetical protein